MNVVTIVEGDGEVAAVPVLLRRLNAWLSGDRYINVLPPLRVRKEQFLNRADVFSRQLQLAAMKAEDDGWILILLDADDDCPAKDPETVLFRARTLLPHRRVSVVYANREFEAWFLAAAKSIDGQRGFKLSEPLPVNPDTIRGAKEWISSQVPGGRYHEVTDQPAFCARFDLTIARDNSRSFRKLCSEWTKNVPLNLDY